MSTVFKAGEAVFINGNKDKPIILDEQFDNGVWHGKAHPSGAFHEVHESTFDLVDTETSAAIRYYLVASIMDQVESIHSFKLNHLSILDGLTAKASLEVSSNG